jgi:hypothetical protein
MQAESLAKLLGVKRPGTAEHREQPHLDRAQQRL